VKLAGISGAPKMTRSKSERDRLLSLAVSVLNDVDESGEPRRTPVNGVSDDDDDDGEEFPSPSSEAPPRLHDAYPISAAEPVEQGGKRLTRSAASELALCLGADMSL